LPKTENPSLSRLSLLPLAAIVASCVQLSAPTGVSLDQQLAGRAAGPPRSCITAFSNSNLTAIDSSTFVYRSGDSIYVNHPSSPCPGIAPLNTLIVDAQQGHYCRGDRVRALEPGSIIAGPVCILGDWVPYRKP
jgi:hypothetical protein